MCFVCSFGRVSALDFTCLIHSKLISQLIRLNTHLRYNFKYFFYIEILLDLYGFSFMMVPMEENSDGMKIVYSISIEKSS